MNDPDPPFFTQICPLFSYAKLRDTGFNIHGGGFSFLTLAPDESVSAVFAVKVSFVDGGCIVCLSPHHSFFDGRGAFKIAESFASYCNGRPKCLGTGRLHDRLQLLHGESGFRTHKHFPAGPIADGVDSYPALSRCAKDLSLISVIFSITNQDAKDLRFTLFSCKDIANTVSRLDVITSLLFTRIMKARSPDLPAGTICSLNTAVDARSRLDPPVSNDYLGNVVIGACLEICLRDLALNCDDEDMEQIAQIASTLRARVLAIDDNAMRIYISHLDSQPNIEQYFDKTHPTHQEASLMCSSWVAWPAHELDFGMGLGKPESVRSHTGDSRDLRVQPRSGREGNWEVTAVLDQGLVEELKDDRLLQRWCSIKCLQ